MEIRRVLLLTIAILCMIAFLVFFFIDLFSIGRNSSPPRPGEFNIAYRQIPFHRFLLSLILLIISIFTLSYYFLSRLLESRLEKNMMLISKLISRGKENVITKKRWWKIYRQGNYFEVSKSCWKENYEDTYWK